MSFSITRSQRSLLFFFSASGYIAWCSGLDSRLEAQIVAAPGPRPLASLAQRPPPRVSSIIRRDPFVEEQPASISAADSNGDAAPVPDAALADDGPSVPNIAELPSIDASGPQTLVLKATIAGPNPVAYVRDGADMDIVRVGDLLAGRRVRRIDLQGLEFGDGSRLELPGAFVATPAPETPNPSNAVIPIADLRKLLAAQQGTPKVPPAAASPQATAAPTPSGYPTPGPLPTVNQRGIPVGVNPTPDLSAPTAFPYPYPYPPTR
jgi:hypothetical protein